MHYKTRKASHKFVDKAKKYFYPVENVTIILLSYLFSAMNFFVAGLYYGRMEQGNLCGNLIFIGCVLFVMVPICIVDSRKQNRGRFAAVCGIIVHFVFCLGFALIYSYQWLLVYFGEVIVGAVLLVFMRRILK
ncbi:MAG: hypothetical protein IJB96_09585 [Lachnospira sp.]|nr:hypothetical protein [Lachnospira sp.]